MFLKRSLLALVLVLGVLTGRAEAIVATLQFPAAATGTTQYGGECDSGTGHCSAFAYLEVSTDVTATCKWDTSNVAYASMGHYFTATGTWTWSVTSWTPNYADAGWPNYAYYWSCQDNNTLATTSTVLMSFTEDHTYPGTIAANLHGVALSGTAVKLQMSDANTGVFNYKWYRNGSLIATTGGGIYIDRTASANTLYSYTAAEVDAGGTEPQSPAFPIHTLPTSAIFASSAVVIKGEDFESGLQVVGGGPEDWNKYLYNSYPYGLGNCYDDAVISTSTAGGAVDGTHSFQMHMTGLFSSPPAAFPGYSCAAAPSFEMVPWTVDGTRHFNHEYIKSGVWVNNTFNRMRLWIKTPSDFVMQVNGKQNMEFGTYVGSSHRPCCGGGTEEGGFGGNHFYHHFNFPHTDQWYQIIVDTHPSYQRQGPVFDYTNHAYFSGEPGWSYFDGMSRFYIDLQVSSPPPTLAFPTDFYIDDIEYFYEDDTTSDIDHISSISGGYDAASHTVYVGWSHPKDDGTTKSEVVYAFSDIHALGWNNATVFPGTSGGLTPPSDVYSMMNASSAAITTTGHSSIFVGMRLVGDTAFRQIQIPLAQTGTPGAGSRARIRGGGSE